MKPKSTSETNEQDNFKNFDFVFQQMANEKKEYEDKMEELRKGWFCLSRRKYVSEFENFRVARRSSRKRLEREAIRRFERFERKNNSKSSRKSEKTKNEKFRQSFSTDFFQEETLEMEIYKLKTDLDSSLITQQALREMISSRENELFQEQQRIVEVKISRFPRE